MAYHITRPRIISILVLFLLLLVFPAQVDASDESALPSLEEFIVVVGNGEASALRGIYVPELFAYSIIPQLDGSPAYVSTKSDTLTQFGLASRYGSTGLLAHNYLAGDRFTRLKEGQLLYLIFGDGNVDVFIVSRFLRFQALTPNSVTSNFVDLENGDLLSATQLFFDVYKNPGKVVLQTCIYAHGESSWGRLFIIAEPYDVRIVQASSDLKTISE